MVALPKCSAGGRSGCCVVWALRWWHLETESCVSSHWMGSLSRGWGVEMRDAPLWVRLYPLEVLWGLELPSALLACVISMG